MASRLLEEELAMAKLLWKKESKVGIDAYEFASWVYKEAVAVKTAKDNGCCTLFSQVDCKFF